MSEFGQVHVYTGNGKGKTTAAVGAGLRAAGHGYSVHMVQFMKGEWFPQYGEVKSLQDNENFTVEQFATQHFIEPDDVTEHDRETVEKAMEASRRAVDSNYDIVILDEINVASHFGLVSEDEMLELIESKSPETELILTGRYAPESVIHEAGLVTRMENVRHPYDGDGDGDEAEVDDAEGMEAREGIEW